MFHPIHARVRGPGGRRSVRAARAVPISIALATFLSCVPVVGTYAADEATWDYGYTGQTAQFVVPYDGDFLIEAFGAQGGDFGGNSGGRGNKASGTFTLKAGDVLELSIGGAGFSGTDGTPSGSGGSPKGGQWQGGASFGQGAGGGSASLVTLKGDTDTLLVVGGGGGGANAQFPGYSGDNGMPTEYEQSEWGAPLGWGGQGGGYEQGVSGRPTMDDTPILAHIPQTWDDGCYVNGDRVSEGHPQGGTIYQNGQVIGYSSSGTHYYNYRTSALSDYMVQPGFMGSEPQWITYAGSNGMTQWNGERSLVHATSGANPNGAVYVDTGYKYVELDDFSSFDVGFHWDFSSEILNPLRGMAGGSWIERWNDPAYMYDSQNLVIDTNATYVSVMVQDRDGNTYELVKYTVQEYFDICRYQNGVSGDGFLHSWTFDQYCRNAGHPDHQGDDPATHVYDYTCHIQKCYGVSLEATPERVKAKTGLDMHEVVGINVAWYFKYKGDCVTSNGMGTGLASSYELHRFWTVRQGYGAEGGSSYVAPIASGPSTTPGVRTGDGFVRITCTHTHSWEKVGHEDPWCLTDGYDKWRCSCGEERTDVIPALGHDSSGSYAYANDNGVTDGLKYKDCARCGERLDSLWLNRIRVRYQNPDGTYTDYSDAVSSYLYADNEVSWSRAADAAYAAASRSWSSAGSARSEDVTVYRNKVALNVDGLLDGVMRDTLTDADGFLCGTFDVYVNGALVASGVDDYYNDGILYGSTYEFKSVAATEGHSYDGVYSGGLSGTLTAGTTTVLSFSTNWYDVVLTKGVGITDVSGGGRFKYGRPVSIDATVARGFTWKDWTGTWTLAGKSSTFSMPAQDVALTANAHDITAPEVLEASHLPYPQWVNTDVVITVYAEDWGVGLADEPYSYDEGLTWTADNTHQVPVNGDYPIWARDKEGNISRIVHPVRNIDKVPPTIEGLAALYNKDYIDREWEGPIDLWVHVTDDASGVASAVLTVTNHEDGETMSFTADADGNIHIDITDGNIFYGGFDVEVVATDVATNVTVDGFDTTEFLLETSLTRLLGAPHDTYKTGESGRLDLTAWGWVDEVYVYFPSEFQTEHTYDQHYVYPVKALSQTEAVQFMVPLGTPERGDYEIVVEAWKDGVKLTQHLHLSVVHGNVLDELRTRLR